MSGILRLGVFLPEQERTNAFWGERWEAQHAHRASTDVITQVDATRDVDPEVAKHSARFAADLYRGTRTRRVMANDQVSSDMEANAARAAMGDQSVDLLVVASQVPDFPSPLNHGLVAHKLGLPPTTTAMTLDTGCASFVTGVATACRLVDTGAYNSAVVVVSSAMSRIMNASLPSSPFVGDGAVAALIGPSPPGTGFVDDEVLTRGDLHGGILLVAPEQPETPWYRGDLHHQALQATHYDPVASHAMGARAVTRCREVCAPLLARHQLAPDQIQFMAVSQTTAWFGAAMAEGLGIPADRVLSHEDHFARFGHLMAASSALNLAIAEQQGRIQSGDWVLLYSPGAGFTQAAQLMRWV